MLCMPDPDVLRVYGEGAGLRLMMHTGAYDNAFALPDGRWQVICASQDTKLMLVPVSGGLRLDITGPGRTQQAIRAMVGPHTNELNQMKEWSAETETIPGGVRLTVVAKDPADANTVARIRGLGFIGLLV